MSQFSKADAAGAAGGIAGVVILVSIGSSFGSVALAGTLLVPFAVVATFRFPIIGWLLWVAATTCSGSTISVLGLALQPEVIAFPLLCIAVYRERRGATDRSSGDRPVALALMGVALLLWLVVNLCSSLLVAPVPASSLRILALMSVSVATFFVLIRLPADRVASYVRAGVTLMAFVAIVSIGAWLAAQATGSGNAFVVKNYGESVFRTKWLMIEPNLLASLLVLWLTVAVVFRRSFKTGGLVVISGLLGVCAFLSFTRAAWVGLIVLALVLLVSGRRAPLQVLLAGVAGLVLVGYFGADLLNSGQGFGQTFSDRVTGIIDLKSGTGAYRTRAWKVALSDVQSYGHFFGGLGTNSFSQRHGAVDSTTGQAYLGNFWIVLLYDSGLAGVVAFAVAAIVMIWRTLRWTTIPFFVSLFLAAFATNPMWFGYPWALMALLWVGASATLQSPKSENALIARMK
jgi:hypothetical protein